MRRREFFKVSGLGLVSFALRGTGAFGAEGHSGAVKLELRRTGIGPEEVPDSDELVGWAIVNTTPDDLLSIKIHLDEGEPEAEYDIFAEINGRRSAEALGTVATNGQGKGRIHLELDLDDYEHDGESVDVRVIGDSEEAGFASDTAPVSLKKKAKKKKVAKKKKAKKKAKKKVAKKKKKAAKKKVAKKKKKKTS